MTSATESRVCRRSRGSPGFVQATGVAGGDVSVIGVGKKPHGSDSRPAVHGFQVLLTSDGDRAGTARYGLM